MIPTTHSKWNGLAVICIVGLVVVACVAAIIAYPFYKVAPDPMLSTIVISGMTALLGLLKSAQPPTDVPPGTQANPVQVEVANTPQNAVPTQEATP